MLKHRLLDNLRIRKSLMVFMVGLLLILPAFAQELKTEIKQAWDHKQYDQVVTLLQNEISADPGYHLNYYWLGRAYYELAQYKDAREQFAYALDKKGNHYESLYYLALCELKLGNLEAAQKAIKKGLKKAKDFKAEFENASGLLALRQKDYQGADRAFRMALADNEAQLEKKLKDLKDAPYPPDEKEKIIQQTQQKYLRENAEFHINLGDANFYQGVPALAVIEYEKALKIDTASLEVYYHWAEACLDMKDFNCALEKLKVVLTKDSTHAPAWMRAGEIYFKAGRSSRTRAERAARFKEAIGAYQKYLQLTNAQPDSSNVRVFFEMAMSYNELRGYEEAIPFFEKVLAIPFVPKDIYFNYGKALFWNKQYDKAGEMLQKHLEWAAQQGEDYHTTVKEWELYQLLGDSYFYRKPRDYYTAIDYYKKSLALRPGQKRLLYNIAIGYHTIKKYGEAMEYYDKRIALGIDSSQAGLLRNAGSCALSIAGGGGGDEEFDLGDEMTSVPAEADTSGINPNVNYYEKAIGYYKQYLEYNPDDLKVLNLVANTYLYQLQDCANGVAAFENVLSHDPGSCAALKAIGFAYFSGEICSKNYTKALRYLRKAYTCIKNGAGACSDVEIPLWIAQCYHLRAASPNAEKEQANSDFKNAFDWYGRVLKCDPGNADAKKGQNDTRFEFN